MCARACLCVFVCARRACVCAVRVCVCVRRACVRVCAPCVCACPCVCVRARVHRACVCLCLCLCLPFTNEITLPEADAVSLSGVWRHARGKPYPFQLPVKALGEPGAQALTLAATASVVGKE